jgi:hypothetical protein
MSVSSAARTLALLCTFGFAVLPPLIGQAAKATDVAANVSSMTVANKRYDAEKELARLTRRYSLTDDQRTKIQPALVDQQKQVHRLGEDTSLSNAEWWSEVRTVHQQTVELVKAQMTDAQASRYLKDEAKEAKKSQNDAQDDGPDGPPPDGPPPGGGPGGPGGGGPPM